MKKEFDINRGEYDKKVEEIRKKKRTLRNIQEPFLVKKIKKELKVTQRGAKRGEKSLLKGYLKEQVNEFMDNEELIFKLRELTFHHNDDTAIPLIDEYLLQYPQLLDINDKEWYYKYC